VSDLLTERCRLVPLVELPGFPDLATCRLWSVELLADGSIVGVAGLSPLAGKWALHCYLLPEWTGLGLGGEVSRALIARAWADGLDGLVALTTADNLAAQRCLVGLGFRRVGEKDGQLGYVLEGPAKESPVFMHPAALLTTGKDIDRMD
jgi:RimJ/RimL family protein N-acetyltransferase